MNNNQELIENFLTDRIRENPQLEEVLIENPYLKELIFEDSEFGDYIRSHLIGKLGLFISYFKNPAFSIFFNQIPVELKDYLLRYDMFANVEDGKIIDEIMPYVLKDVELGLKLKDYVDSISTIKQQPAFQIDVLTSIGKRYFFHKNKMEGLGTYTGFYYRKKKHGYGRMIGKNGNIMEGSWENNHFQTGTLFNGELYYCVKGECVPADDNYSMGGKARKKSKKRKAKRQRRRTRSS
jgi:hypothetical protein